ncbi:MAG: hypothetical protein IT453_15985 [Planctomycetes bacterium]|nr:hypothetical protein [Planctomycetota bacterium]
MSTKPVQNGEPPAPRARWPKLALLAVGALALIATALVFYWDARGKDGLTRELELWRESGDPYLELESRPATALPEEFQRWFDAFDQPPCDTANEGLDAAEIAALPACAQPFADAGIDEFQFTRCAFDELRDPSSASSLDACERALIEAHCARALDCAAGVRAARELAAIPGTTLLRGGRTLDEVPLSLELRTMVRASGIALCVTRYRLLHGDFDEALEFSRDGFEIARVASGAPLLIGHQEWLLAVDRALDGFQELLHALPAGTDLTWFETELARLDVRAQLAASVRSERLAGRHTLEGLRRPERGDDLDFLSHDRSRFLVLQFLSHSQALYLGAYRRAIAHVDSPTWREPPTEPIYVRASWPFGRYTELAAAFIPLFDREIDRTVRLEARIELARAAIVNHRDGTAAARAWLAGRTDPFSGKPLRSRVDPDGVLVMWSVGADRVDGGAPRRPPGCVDWPEHDLDWLASER